MKEVKEYDTNGNLTYFRDSNGYTELCEFDANNNMTHYRNSYGYEWWREYNANNKLIHFRNSNRNEQWYDAKGNMIHFRDSSGEERWYDAKGKKITKAEFDKLYPEAKEKEMTETNNCPANQVGKTTIPVTLSVTKQKYLRCCYNCKHWILTTLSARYSECEVVAACDRKQIEPCDVCGLFELRKSEEKNG